MINVKVLNKDKNFKISSFCSVTTKEVKREALFLICSINRIYNGVPILIFCGDEESKEYIDRQKTQNVLTQLRPPPLNLKVTQKNKYHKPDVIALKMDVLELAIRSYRNSVFLDSDIILLEKLNGPNDCEVALSHNLTETRNVAKQSVLDGMFNAGMVWSNTTRFTKWWRQEYLSGRSTFYEQSILNYVPNVFRTSYFDLRHNYGFWRGWVGDRGVYSFHCHLDRKLDDTFVPYMVTRVDPLRESVIKSLKDKYQPLYFQYERIFV